MLGFPAPQKKLNACECSNTVAHIVQVSRISIANDTKGSKIPSSKSACAVELSDRQPQSLKPTTWPL